MGRMSEIAYDQEVAVILDQMADSHHALHQLSQEREQMAQEAAKRLATGVGGRQEIEILCREAGIDSPYK